MPVSDPPHPTVAPPAHLTRLTPPSASAPRRFPGCLRRYASSDAVRKHATKEHREWVRSLPAQGPAHYCREFRDDESPATSAGPKHFHHATPPPASPPPAAPQLAPQLHSASCGLRETEAEIDGVTEVDEIDEVSAAHAIPATAAALPLLSLRTSPSLTVQPGQPAQPAVRVLPAPATLAAATHAPWLELHEATAGYAESLAGYLGAAFPAAANASEVDAPLLCAHQLLRTLVEARLRDPARAGRHHEAMAPLLSALHASEPLLLEPASAPLDAEEATAGPLPGCATALGVLSAAADAAPSGVHFAAVAEEDAATMAEAMAAGAMAAAMAAAAAAAVNIMGAVGHYSSTLAADATTGQVFECRYPGCLRHYGSTDAVRKHARKQHREWVGSLPSQGPAHYCREVTGVPLASVQPPEWSD